MTDNERSLELDNYRLRLELAYHKGGSPKLLEEALAEFQRQRDIIQSISEALERYDAEVNNTLDMAQSNYFASEHRFAEIARQAEVARVAQARLGMVLHRVMVQQMDVENAAIDKAKTEIPADEGEHVLSGLRKLGLKVRQATVFDFGTRAALHAAALSGDPQTIISIICHDLRARHQVSITALEELPLDWIREQIPNAPASYQLIKKYLELAESQKQSGKTIVAFAAQSGVIQRNVERAVSFYERFVGLSKM